MTAGLFSLIISPNKSDPSKTVVSTAINPGANQQGRVEQWGRQRLGGSPHPLSPQFGLPRAAFLLQHPVPSQLRPLNPCYHRLPLVSWWVNGADAALNHRASGQTLLVGTTDPGTPLLAEFLAMRSRAPGERGGIYTGRWYRGAARAGLGGEAQSGSFKQGHPFNRFKWVSL